MVIPVFKMMVFAFEGACREPDCNKFKCPLPASANQCLYGFGVGAMLSRSMVDRFSTVFRLFCDSLWSILTTGVHCGNN